MRHPQSAETLPMRMESADGLRERKAAPHLRPGQPWRPQKLKTRVGGAQRCPRNKFQNLYLPRTPRRLAFSRESKSSLPRRPSIDLLAGHKFASFPFAAFGFDQSTTRITPQNATTTRLTSTLANGDWAAAQVGSLERIAWGNLSYRSRCVGSCSVLNHSPQRWRQISARAEGPSRGPSTPTLESKNDSRMGHLGCVGLKS